MATSDMNRHGWMWSVFTVRWVLGLIFVMAGWWKCFVLTPAEHARHYFIGPFAEQWIPEWLLWTLGATIPVVELLAGILVCLGLFRKAAYIALGAVLVTVTYGHLLQDSLFNITGHIFPRLVLLVFVWSVPAQYDVFSGDRLVEWIRIRPAEPAT